MEQTYCIPEEMTHTRQQAKDLFASIDTGTAEGRRDYALISLLLRTGTRRSECVALNIDR